MDEVKTQLQLEQYQKGLEGEISFARFDYSDGKFFRVKTINRTSVSRSSRVDDALETKMKK